MKKVRAPHTHTPQSLTDALTHTHTLAHTLVHSLS